MSANAEFNLKLLLISLCKKAWIIILAALVLGGATAAITIYYIEPTYTSSIKLYVNNSTDLNTSIISSGDIAASQYLVDTYITIIQSETMLREVTSLLGLSYSAEEINKMMSAGAVNNTEIFRVSINSAKPEEAAAIANAIAEIAPGYISAIVKGSSVKIVDKAQIPIKASSPDLVLNIVIGALIGCVLTVSAIFLNALFDTHIKTETDLESISELPILGVISKFKRA